MSNSDLQQRAASIGALLDQVEDLKTEIKARFEVAKNDGYNASALRKAIAISRLDDKRREKHDTAQGDLMLYLEEIEGRRIQDAKTPTEATPAYLEQSRRLREAAE